MPQRPRRAPSSEPAPGGRLRLNALIGASGRSVKVVLMTPFLAISTTPSRSTDSP